MLRSASHGVVLSGDGSMADEHEQRRFSTPTTLIELQRAEM